MLDMLRNWAWKMYCSDATLCVEFPCKKKKLCTSIRLRINDVSLRTRDKKYYCLITENDVTWNQEGSSFDRNSYMYPKLCPSVASEHLPTWKRRHLFWTEPSRAVNSVVISASSTTSDCSQNGFESVRRQVFTIVSYFLCCCNRLNFSSKLRSNSEIVLFNHCTQFSMLVVTNSAVFKRFWR